MNSQIIGNITLNISFLLYLSNYFPQLFHNRKQDNLVELCLSFHCLLFIAYISDLVFAVGMHMPWQYILVSVIGSSCLLYQHYQLWQLYSQQRLFRWLTIVAVALLSLSLISIFFIKLNNTMYLSLEYTSQFCGILFFMPQLIRNMKFASARSLSLWYVGMGLGTALCDTLSAWCLAWPLPNKIGTAIRLTLGLVLLLQCVYYTYLKTSAGDSLATTS